MKRPRLVVRLQGEYYYTSKVTSSRQMREWWDKCNNMSKEQLFEEVVNVASNLDIWRSDNDSMLYDIAYTLFVQKFLDVVIKSYDDLIAKIRTMDNDS